MAGAASKHKHRTNIPVQLFKAIPPEFGHIVAALYPVHLSRCHHIVPAQAGAAPCPLETSS